MNFTVFDTNSLYNILNILNDSKEVTSFHAKLHVRLINLIEVRHRNLLQADIRAVIT